MNLLKITLVLILFLGVSSCKTYDSINNYKGCVVKSKAPAEDFEMYNNTLYFKVSLEHLETNKNSSIYISVHEWDELNVNDTIR